MGLCCLVLKTLRTQDFACRRLMTLCRYDSQWLDCYLELTNTAQTCFLLYTALLVPLLVSLAIKLLSWPFSRLWPELRILRCSLWSEDPS